MTPSETRFFVHLGLILLILLLIPVVHLLVISDIPPVDDSDLTRPQIAIAAALGNPDMIAIDLQFLLPKEEIGHGERRAAEPQPK